MDKLQIRRLREEDAEAVGQIYAAITMKAADPDFKRVVEEHARREDEACFVAERDGLDIQTVLGDMADLTTFQDQTFDLIVHPVSNCFIPDVLPVWQEAFRVLRPGAYLLAGFLNPVEFAFQLIGDLVVISILHAERVVDTLFQKFFQLFQDK